MRCRSLDLFGLSFIGLSLSDLWLVKYCFVLIHVVLSVGNFFSFVSDVFFYWIGSNIINSLLTMALTLP